MKKALILLVTILFGTVLFASNATAIPITGEIGFVGLFAPTGGTGLADATGLTFPSSFLFAADATDDFTPAAPGNATFNPFDFAPLSPSPVNPLWSITAGSNVYSFALESVAIDVQNSTALNLSGSGTLNITGLNFDPTPGSWIFTGNTQGVVFTFSSGSAATSVPDADIMFLLGTALIGLGLISMRRSKV